MQNLKDVIAAVEVLQGQVTELEAARIEDGVEIENIQKQLGSIKVRDRGPKSQRTMTRNDAWRVMHGDLKELSHKAAAAQLGLSYGQVYSARGDYTFKDVKVDEFSLEPTVEAQAPTQESAAQ